MKRSIHPPFFQWIANLPAKRIATCVVMVGAGFVAGAGWLPSGLPRAAAQSSDQPQHFQSGSQLSLPLLQEIAATLKQMDARLARIETAAQQLQPARGKQAPTRSDSK
jgi:hypothetical protein